MHFYSSIFVGELNPSITFITELQRRKDLQESKLPQANPSTSAPEERINLNMSEPHESNTIDL